MDDLISRQATVKAIEQHKTAALEGHIWDEGIKHGYAAAHRHIVDIVEQLPSVQPDTTTHDSISAETGKNDGDGTSGDCISRQQAIEAVEKSMYENPHENAIIRGMHDHEHRHFLTILMGLPSIQPERKRGKWIERESDTEDKENGFKTVIVCSCCDFPATTFYSEDCESRTQIRTDFCPNCGAKMEKR